jgi:hypothetical protein
MITELNPLVPSMEVSAPICLPASGAQGTGLPKLSSPQNCFDTLHLRDSIFLSRFGVGPVCGADGRAPDFTESKSFLPVSGAETAPVIQTRESFAAFAESAASADTCVPVLQRDTRNGCSSVQINSTGFSLFHFGGPVAVSPKDLKVPALIAPFNESKSGKGFESLSKTSKCGPLKEASGGSMDINTTAAEYSLFATARNGLVFF